MSPYGPRAADLALATVAERLRALPRRRSWRVLLGRIGADQFGIILPVSEQAAVSEFLIAAKKRFPRA
jgi:GGDEF domain-containing protein